MVVHHAHEPLDPFGDHLLCCKKNKLVQRHNAVRDALALVLKENHVRCETEVAIGGKTRPADVAILGFDPAGPLAVDLVVFHPLQKSMTWEEETAIKSMAVTEGKKVTKNQPICESAGWLFSPLSFHPWAGLGPLGSGLVNRLVKQILGDRQGWARQHMSADIWQRLSATLMSHVGEQLGRAWAARYLGCNSERRARKGPQGGARRGRPSERHQPDSNHESTWCRGTR